jgi:tetratricopeptide (TPR) repeat protein
MAASIEGWALFRWFNAREAAEVGATLADEFPLTVQTGAALAHGKAAQGRKHGDALQAFLRQAVEKIHALNMNFYKRARLANAFRWRLLEKGVDAETALEATQTLVLHLTAESKASLAGGAATPTVAAEPSQSGSARSRLAQAEAAFARGAYAEAVGSYQDFIELKPPRADVLNRLGTALYRLGRYQEAEEQFRRAIRKDPNHSEAHGNLGAAHLSRGLFAEAENSLRRALKIKPNHLEQRANLGVTLMYLNRLRDSQAQFEKVLRVSPRHAEALYGMGLLARMEGHFDEAAAFFDRALEVDQTMARAWTASAGLRKLKVSDRDWLERGEKFASSGNIAALDAAGVRFAIGKYHDDVGEYEAAFKNYERANELLKSVSPPYDRDARARMVDDLIRVYSRETIARTASGASDSRKPVFVVGMMRSGTSLTEQILASHPAIAGAGELYFWSDVMRRHESQVRREVLGGPIRQKLATDYLGALSGYSADAARVVDKAPPNSDYLGVIHSVFPNARIIYMQRDPIDTCLSCYFQPFPATLSFSTDLSDLAHYYREHQRLIAHWQAVLPPGTILNVPYEELVADQEGWTRRMIDFLGLDWDERCLSFHNTQRPVGTASFWQVRQKIYRDSVQRWRHYRKFIAPLLDLKES